MNNWQAALIDWRCRLSAAERHRYGAPPGWNCRDVKISVGRDRFRSTRSAACGGAQRGRDLVQAAARAGRHGHCGRPRRAQEQLGVPLVPRFAWRRSAPPSVPLPAPGPTSRAQVRQEPLRPPRRNSAAATTSSRYPSRCVSISETGWLVRSLPTSATIRFFTSAWKARRKSASVRGGAAMTRAGHRRGLRTTSLQCGGDPLDEMVLLEVMPVGLVHAAAPMRAGVGKGRRPACRCLARGSADSPRRRPARSSGWEISRRRRCAGTTLCGRRRRKPWRRGGLRAYSHLTPQAAPASPSRLSGRALSTPDTVFQL